MSQLNLASRIAKTYVGIESTAFTLSGTMVASSPDVGSVDVSTFNQSIIEVPDQKVYGYDYSDPTLGLKSGSPFKLGARLRPDGTQLDNTNIVPATPPWLAILLRGAFGDDSASYAPSTTGAAAGCLLSGTPGTGTSITVASGKGSLFAVGQWVAIQTSNGLEPARITGISTDTLTISPAVTGTPVATTGKVMAGYTFGVHQAHAKTLSFQHALVQGSGNYQWQALGACVKTLEFSFEHNGHPKLAFGFEATTWQGPTALSLDTSAFTDTMVAPTGTRNATSLVQGYATTTKTNYVVHSIAAKIDLMMQPIMEMGSSGTEGVAGYFRTPDPSKPFGTLDLTVLSDAASQTDFTSQNKLQVVQIWTTGSGTAQRFMFVDFPTCVPIKSASYKDSNGRTVTALSLALKKDASTTGSTSDLAYSPMRIGWI